MKRLTVDDIMKMHPCCLYPRARVEELWAGRESLSALEILDLPITAADRLWALLRRGVLPGRVLLLFAAACVERRIEVARQRGVQIDPRTAAVPAAIRDYAEGRIGHVAMRRVWFAAYAAAEAADAAACDAAYTAAYAATSAAAEYLAAASDADREAQIRDLRRLIAEEQGEQLEEEVER